MADESDDKRADSPEKSNEMTSLEENRPSRIMPVGRKSFPRSEDQNIAMELILAWFKRRGDHRMFVLGGYAGTGKTVLISDLIEELKNRYEIAVGAFTGKAVSVLRSKGIDIAMTLHRMLYDRKKDTNGRKIWIPKIRVPYRLIIVDEASMVSRELKKILDALDVKVLYVGDPAQLEPIGEDPRIMHTPNFMMTDIRRQAEGNPIIRLTGEIREGRADLQNGFWTGKDGAGSLRIVDSTAELDLRDYGMIISGYNSTRHRYNAEKRRLLGFSGDLQVGENVICLRNEKNVDIFNGLILQVESVEDAGDHYLCDLNEEIDGTRYGVEVDKQFFGYDYRSNEHRGELRMDATPFDWANAASCHKFQGSEERDVLGIEEVLKGEHKRWLYTMITRSSMNITIVRHRSRARNAGLLVA